MTFKATLLHGSQLRLAGFVEHELIVPLKPHEKRRTLWASPDVAALFKGLKNPDAMFPCLKADVQIGTFCKGYIVSATRRESGKSDFKWLRNIDEVWVMSFRKPPPGWRVFGRFAKEGVFVAMCCHDRHELGDMVGYNRAAQAMLADWEVKFPGVGPFRGSGFRDYLGEMHRNDDE